jgi:hypothetical protein
VLPAANVRLSVESVFTDARLRAGTAFQGTLTALMRSGRSAVLLQPPHGADGPGTLITSSSSSYAVVARCEATPPPASGISGASPSSYAVKDILSGPASSLEFVEMPGSTYSCMPLVVFLPADVLGRVDSSSVLREIAQKHSDRSPITEQEGIAVGLHHKCVFCCCSFFLL